MLGVGVRGREWERTWKAWGEVGREEGGEVQNSVFTYYHDIE